MYIYIYYIVFTTYRVHRCMMYKNNNFLESRKTFDWILEATSRILGDPNSKILPPIGIHAHPIR